MVGPKLDARTYTTLVLTVIAVLLTLNLVTAQSGKQQTLYTDAAANADIAAATREVAASNLKIAESNAKIADSIDNLARAVGKVKLEVKTDGSGSSAPTSSADDEGESAAPSTTGGDVIFDLN